jgi:hypothetical protein
MPTPWFAHARTSGKHGGTRQTGDFGTTEVVARKANLYPKVGRRASEAIPDPRIACGIETDLAAAIDDTREGPRRCAAAYPARRKSARCFFKPKRDFRSELDGV